MRLGTRRSLALLLLTALATPPLHAQEGPSFPSQLDIVTVDVVVTDKQGNPVQGLTAADFTLREEGKPQTISSFEVATLPEFQPSTSPMRSRVSTNDPVPKDQKRPMIVIVFDDVNISAPSGSRARKAITDFLEKGLRPGDEVMIVPTAGGSWWTGRMPEDRDSLLAFVSRIEGKYRPDNGPDRIWDHEAMAIWLGRDPQILSFVARRWFENNLIPESYPTDRDAAAALDVSPGLAHIRAKAQTVYIAAQSRLRATLDMLTRLSEALTTMRGRKNLFLVSEGFIMDSSQGEFREALRAARQANTVVHFVDAGAVEGAAGKAGMAGGDAEFGRTTQEDDSTTLQALAIQSTQGARSVAVDTGGSFLPSTGNLGAAMTRVVEESRAYYLLGYTSSDGRHDGGYRKIQVAVSRPDVQVHARRGYYAPKDGERRKEDPDKLDPQVRHALDAPDGSGALPLRFTSYVFGPAPEGKQAVLLLAEADLSNAGLKAVGGTVSADLETFVVVHARDSGEVQHGEKQLSLSVPEARWDEVRRAGIPIRREFQLAPGAYQARLLVRDRKHGLLGTVRHEFEVPETKALRTSTPILTDAFAPGAAPSDPPRPVPVARRSFRPGSRLGYAYEVFGAAADPAQGGRRVSASYVVRKADGTAVSNGPSRPLTPTGLFQLSQVLIFGAPSEPGEYAVVLDVKDEAANASIQVVDPFLVAP